MKAGSLVGMAKKWKVCLQNEKANSVGAESSSTALARLVGKEGDNASEATRLPVALCLFPPVSD